MSGLVIAIDGVVGAGKTTTARMVAGRLGFRHLDTGAMYRAVTVAATRRGIAAGHTASLASMLAALTIDLEPDGRVLLNGEDVSDAIRRPEVTRAVGAYSDAPVVRKALVAQQQRMGAAGGIVAEGRDMAAVVFPCAELKISMVADLDERVERRYRELQQKGVVITPEQVRVDIETRDREDAARDYGVGGEGPEVTEIDTTDMTLEGQVDHIVALARQHGA